MRKSPLAFSFDVLINYLLSPVKRPLLASYKLTYRCNLRCLQCPFREFGGASPTFAQACQVLDQLSQRGNRLIVFEGGEPLLWCDERRGNQGGGYRFQDVVDYARERFVCVGVTTNGTMPLDVSTDILWVSIDGFADTHNRLRQAEARDLFHQVIENIRDSSHPRLYAHITANRENYTQIPELVRFLAGIVRGITLQFYYPYHAEDHLFLPWDKRRALLDELIRMRSQGYPILNSAASLRALRENHWRCMPWLFDCANPDNSIHQGCYLQGRAAIDCRKCGFSPHTEMSLAFQGHPGAILAGMKIFM
jgi:MoaA/NifB/PqqE/SkfB family radical SAM enzyme